MTNLEQQVHAEIKAAIDQINERWKGKAWVSLPVWVEFTHEATPTSTLPPPLRPLATALDQSSDKAG